MPKRTLQTVSAAAFFFGSKSQSAQHCINFSQELRASLDLLHAGVLADYFPQAAAATSALAAYLFLMKAFAKPKKVLALCSLPVVYLLSLKLAHYLIVNVFSYCF